MVPLGVAHRVNGFSSDVVALFQGSVHLVNALREACLCGPAVRVHTVVDEDEVSPTRNTDPVEEDACPGGMPASGPVPVSVLRTALLALPVVHLDGGHPRDALPLYHTCECPDGFCGQCTLLAVLAVAVGPHDPPLAVTSDHIVMVPRDPGPRGGHQARVQARAQARLGFPPGVPLTWLAPGGHLNLQLFIRHLDATTPGATQTPPMSTVWYRPVADLDATGWPGGVPPGATLASMDPGTACPSPSPSPGTGPGPGLEAPPGAEFAWVSPHADPRLGEKTDPWVPPPTIPNLFLFGARPRVQTPGQVLGLGSGPGHGPVTPLDELVRVVRDSQVACQDLARFIEMNLLKT